MKIKLILVVTMFLLCSGLVSSKQYLIYDWTSDWNDTEYGWQDQIISATSWQFNWTDNSTGINATASLSNYAVGRFKLPEGAFGWNISFTMYADTGLDSQRVKIGIFDTNSTVNENGYAYAYGYDYYRFFKWTSGSETELGDSGADAWNPGAFNFTLTREGNNLKLYRNGIQRHSVTDSAFNNFSWVEIQLGPQVGTIIISNLKIYGNSTSVTGETPPVLSDINCTSCNIPEGDTEPPYTTLDTTPTFRFLTDKDSFCRIGNQDLNYTSMTPLRNCTTGEGGTGPHICTLYDFDELPLTNTSYVYISCRNEQSNESTASNSGPLEMQITNIALNSSASIEKGILNSVAYGATIYTNQQIYVRTYDNNQALATFDKVALYGNQRWAFNYISENETSIGAFYNLTPVFYFLEMVNLTSPAIISQVSMLINETKT